MSDSTSLLKSLVLATEWAAIAYFFAVSSFYGALLVSALWQVWQHARRARNEQLWRVLGSENSPGISILVPAYNEAATILTSVRAMLAISYPRLEVVVANDGSKDDTLEILKAGFDLVPVYPAVRSDIQTAPIRGLYRSKSDPRLTVVDKENCGSRADAVNAALKVAGEELVCAIDADTLIEPDALQRLVRPFLTSDDVAAAGGTIRVVNGCVVRNGRVVRHRAPRNPVARFQSVEYLRAFLFGRIGWNALGGNLIISGAFGLFRRSVLLRVGGYTPESIGEDMELVAKIRGSKANAAGPRKVIFIPDPVAWTEVPSSLKVLGRQRDRWHRGLADVLWSHRRLFMNPRHGALGLVVFPYFVFVELLAPVIELVGLAVTAAGLATGFLNVQHAALMLLVAYAYSLTLTIATFIMDDLAYNRYESVKDRLLLLMWLLLENFGYRQITVYWRLRGLYKYFRGQKGWGQMERQGFQVQSAE